MAGGSLEMHHQERSVTLSRTFSLSAVAPPQASPGSPPYLETSWARSLEYHLNWLYTWRQQVKKGKNPKNTAQMRHSCTISGRKQPEKLILQHLFPLSIFDGEGARGQERYGVSLQRPATSATNLLGKTI
jgi:hypothetical protein